MILKAVKILPYLLPTTANVTMGVLNKPTRANIPDRTITLDTTLQSYGTYTNTPIEYTINRYYSYYNTSNIGTFNGKSMSTTDIYENHQVYNILFQDQIQNGKTYNCRPKHYSLIKYNVAWASLNITLKNLMINIGITNTQSLSTPQVTFATALAMIKQNDDLNRIYNSNWKENRDTLYNTYDAIKTQILNNGTVYYLEGTSDHINDDDILWDGFPNGTYPNIDQQIYLQAGETYYICIITEIDSDATLQMDSLYFDSQLTALTNTELEITVGGQSVVNYPLYEVVDIPGLMFTVLTMPFSFISQAFNITLFPDSIYSVNISGIFLSIIALLVFAWIIKLVLRTLK